MDYGAVTLVLLALVAGVVIGYARGGGVGRLLVQLAVRRGARVLACTSTEEKAALAR